MGSFGYIIVYIIVLIVVCFIAFRVDKKRKAEKQKLLEALISKNDNGNASDKSDEAVTAEKLPFRRKYLLTKNEYWFYKTLKEIAEKYNYAVLAKVRLADLVEVSAEAGHKEYLKYFGKIKSKHIDFMLCNKENLYPELLIELNDGSHDTNDRVSRDNFIKAVVEKTGYNIIFVSGTQNLEEKVLSKIKSEEKASKENKNNNDPPVN